MENSSEELLREKLKALKLKQAEDALAREKQRIEKEVPDFAKKYRFANEEETNLTKVFMQKLNFEFPGHIRIDFPAPLTEHAEMYLRFLGGSEADIKLCIYGEYSDFIRDIDQWQYFSPYLLLIDKGLDRFVYIRDNRDIYESKALA